MVAYSPGIGIRIVTARTGRNSRGQCKKGLQPRRRDEMKALIISEPGRAHIQDIAEPEIGPGEALLRVRRVGLCGSDLNSFRGRNPMVSFPRIPGHEVS